MTISKIACLALIIYEYVNLVKLSYNIFINYSDCVLFYNIFLHLLSDISYNDYQYEWCTYHNSCVYYSQTPINASTLPGTHEGFYHHQAQMSYAYIYSLYKTEISKPIQIENMNVTQLILNILKLSVYYYYSNLQYQNGQSTFSVSELLKNVK